MQYVRHVLGVVCLLLASQRSSLAEYGPPAVLNCSPHIVVVKVSRPDGNLLTVSIQPSAALLQPIVNSSILSIDSANINYGRNELDKLRRRKIVGQELWIVRAAGIELVEFKELRMQRNRCR
jgi:hypothetical protein